MDLIHFIEIGGEVAILNYKFVLFLASDAKTAVVSEQELSKKYQNISTIIS